MIKRIFQDEFEVLIQGSIESVPSCNVFWPVLSLTYAIGNQKVYTKSASLVSFQLTF